MRTLRTQILIAMCLGGLSLVAGLISHLALTDIYHGEADVSLEWNVLRGSAVLFLAFIGCALAALGRTLKVLGSPDGVAGESA